MMTADNLKMSVPKNQPARATKKKKTGGQKPIERSDVKRAIENGMRAIQIADKMGRSLVAIKKHLKALSESNEIRRELTKDPKTNGRSYQYYKD